MSENVLDLLEVTSTSLLDTESSNLGKRPLWASPHAEAHEVTVRG